MSANKLVEKKNTKMETESRSPDSLVISYLVLRKTVGILGMALPVVVYLGARLFFQTGIQSSISSYYHTGMRDVFVGILWTIGFFLYSYKGYEAIDNIAGNLACLFAVMVSIFPTTPDGPITGAQKFIGGIHLVSASLFFLTLIYFSYFLFTKTHKNGQSTSNKLKRNMVYKACAYLMSACILLIALYKILPDSTTTGLESIHPIFWLEALAIFTFGISWFTKGEAILWDEN